MAGRRGLEALQEEMAQPEPRRGGRIGTILAAILALAAVAGVAFVLLTRGEDSAPQRAGQPSPGQSAPAGGGPVSRANTTVAVLNGTTVPGLAAQVADQLERNGFKRGSVTNAADQQRAATTVEYAPGYERAAEQVGALLKVPSARPIDAGTQAIAGPQANVVVTVGTDRTQ
jgi:hypothetical protein